MRGANRADGKRPQTVITLAVPDDSVLPHLTCRPPRFLLLAVSSTGRARNVTCHSDQSRASTRKRVVEVLLFYNLSLAFKVGYEHPDQKAVSTVWF